VQELREQKLELFDHLIGAGEQRPWDVEAERLRGLQMITSLDLDGC